MAPSSTIPRSAVRDASGFVATTWALATADGRNTTASLGYHTYSYRGGFPQADGFYGDESRARWLGADASALRPIGARQKLIVGGEYLLSLRQEQASFMATDPSSRLGDDTRTNIWAVFLQDEIRLGRVIVNVGARFDHHGTFGGVLSPRAALVYGWNGGAAKLLYGQAFRAPSNYELFYQDGYSIKAPPDLDPEHIVTTEAVLEQRLGPRCAAC